jgi:hypothetical protein
VAYHQAVFGRERADAIGRSVKKIVAYIEGHFEQKAPATSYSPLLPEISASIAFVRAELQAIRVELAAQRGR